MPHLPALIRDRYRPRIAKRVPANDHRMSWAGRGHVGAFIVQLLALVLVNLGLWGFFLWSAIRYAERHVPTPSLGGLF